MIAKVIYSVTILSAVFFVAVTPLIADAATISPSAVIEEAKKMRALLQRKRVEGVDVSQAEDLDRRSKDAAQRGDYVSCLRLIREAVAQLHRSGPDSAGEKAAWVELPVDGRAVRITNPVPNSATGEQVGELPELFRPIVRTTDPGSGRVRIRVTDVPIFVEEASQSPTHVTDTPNSSPFGFQDLTHFEPHLKDLNAKWVRLSGPTGIVWDADEPVKGQYDWTRVDRIVNDFHRKNMNIIVTVLCANRWDQKRDFWRVVKGGPFKGARIAVARLPKDLKAFCTFLSKAVERYDGDGIHDAPGSPVINYWQIENEPDGPSWGGTPEEFAQLVQWTTPVIRKSNPNAKILLAGMATPQGYHHFYVPLFDRLKRISGKRSSRWFDIIDFHWSVDSGGDYRFTKNISMRKMVHGLKNKLISIGYRDTQIWVTEMSSYSGTLSNSGGRLRAVTESQHASEMLKSHIHSLSLGIRKVFWVRILEHHNYGNIKANNYWDKTGLIHNPANQGKSHKKLAFYAYKHMVAILEGSDLKNIETLDLGPNIQAYKFLKRNHRPIYVLWYDSRTSFPGAPAN